MQVILRQAAIGDEHRVAEIYLASRKRYLPYAPLAHTDEAVRSWIGSQLIPTGGVTVAVSKETVLGFLAVSKDDRYGWLIISILIHQQLVWVLGLFSLSRQS